MRLFLSTTLALIFGYFGLAGQVLNVTVSKKNSCAGSNNGSITVAVDNTTTTVGPYSYFIFGITNSNGPFVGPLTLGAPVIVTNLPPDNYLVNVSDGDNSISNFNTFQNVTNVSPGISFSVPPTIVNNSSCITPNGQISISPTGGSGSYAFAWTGPSGSFTPPDPLNLTGIVGGNYTVTITDNNANCSFTSSAITVADPSPIPFNVSTSTPSICLGQSGSVQLSNSEAPPVSYEIYNGGVPTGITQVGTGGGLSFTIPAGQLSSVSTFNLTIRATNGFCTPVFMTGTAAITVNPLPVPTITGPTPVCANSTGNVYTTEAGNSGYVWNIAGGIITGGLGTNSVSVTWTTAGAQSISVNYSDANGCAAALPTSIPVTVIAAPTPTITGASSVCVGTTGSIYTTEAGQSSYNWTIVGGTITAGTGTNSVTVNWPTAGPQSISVTYSDVNGCSPAVPTTLGVTVNPLPVPTITGSSTSCLNSTGNVYSTEVGNSSYVWSVSAGGTITSGVGTASITVTWTGTGAQTISVTYVDSNGCSPITPTSAAITVNPLPTVSAPSATLCVGATLNLTPASGGTWASSDNTVATVTNAGLVTGVSSGTATFTFTDATTGCSNTTSSVTILQPTVSTPSPTVCIGATITLSPSTGGTWVSSNASVATVTNAGLVTGVSVGSVTFTFTETATGCTNTTSTVTVNGPPIVTIPLSICVGATANLLPNTGGTWISNDPTVATVTNAGLATGISVGSVIFTFTDAGTGCSSSSVSVPIQQPTVSVPSSNLCVGETMTLTSSAGGTWVSSNNAIATVTNAGLVTGVSAGTATFTFTDSGTGCSNTTSLVTINALPTVSAPSANLCVGATMNLSPSTGGIWVSSNNAIATVTNAGLVTGVSAGTVTFTFTDSGTGCSNTTPSVTVQQPTVSAPLTALCVGATMNLSPSTGGTWVSSDNTVATVTNSGVVTGISAGTVTFTFTETATGCSNSTTPISIQQPVVSAPSGSLCVGATMTLSPASGGTWISSNNTVATVTNAGLVTGVSIGSVTFTYTDGTTGCSNTTSPITINPLPIVSVPSTTLCPGATMNLSPSTGGTWVSSDNTVATVTNAGIVTGVLPGTVTFTFTDGTTGCSNTTSSITITPPPTVSSPSTSVCIGSTLNLFPSTGGTWVSSNNAIATVTNAGLVTGITTGTATFIFTDSGTGCSSTTSSITINDLPVVSTPSATLCVGSTMTLSPAAGGTWVSSDNTIATITNGGLVTGVSAGTATFTFTDSGTGCSNTTSSVTISGALVTSAITGSNSVCANGTGVAYSVTNNLGSSYTWLITGGTQASGGNTNSITVDWAAAGSGNVRVTETNSCTSSPVDLPVTINPNPTSAVLTGNASICAGQSTPLTVTIIGGVAPYSFNITGIGSITGYISSVATPIIVTPPSSTTYTFGGSITDANGCSVIGSGSAFVNVGTITSSPGPGINTWIGDVYDDTGNSAPFYFPGVDYDPAKYRGYIDETEIVGFGTSTYDPTTDKFDLNFAPGHSVLLQGANLCKAYNRNYSIKFRMTKSLAAGAYTFRVSSDDGVRLFIDGNPVTFITPTIPTAFADHGYVTFTSNQFCLPAGPHSFVLDFYQNLGDSRVTFDYDFVANPVTSVSVVTAPSSTTICAGTNVGFTATGVNGGSAPVFQWKKNGVNVGTNSATYSDAALANGDVITVDFSSSLTCAVPSSVTSTPITMTVNPIPAAPVVVSPAIICQGASIDLALSVTPVGTATLLWYTSSTGGIGNPAAPSTSSLPTGTTNFFVSQVDLGCESVRALLSVQVNPSPSAPGVANINYCVGAVAVPLTATGANLLWYSTSTGGVGNAVAPTPSTAIAGTTSFFVSQTVSACESPRAQLDVTVIGPPDNSLAVSPSISNLCTGGSTTIDIVGTQTGVDYQLFDGASLIGSPVAGGGNISIPTGTLTATTTFSVVATYNPANGCSPPITLLNTATITVGGTLNAGLNVAPLLGTLCSGNSTSVRISNSEVNVNYQLRNNTTNAAVGAPVAGTGGSIDLPTGVLATSTSFNVLATSATCSLQLTSLANVVVLPPPNATLTIAGPSSAICPNTSTNITVANSENGVSYQLRLSPSNTNVGSPVVGTGGTITLATPILTLNTSFNVLAIVGSCSAQLANTINVSLLPPGDPSCTVTGNCATVIITPLPTPATCTLSNGSIFFSISPVTPTVNNTGVKITITGQSITNGSVARTNLNNPNFSSLPLGLYSYTIEYGDVSCTKTGFVTIDQSGTVGAPTASNIIGPKCAGSTTGSINLDVPGETGNLLQWSLDGITFTNFTAGNTITGIPSGPAPTFQRVISVRRNASDPCFAAVTITIQDTNPAITVAPPTITDATCSNNDGAIAIGTIAGGVGPYTFRFDSVAYATLPTGSKFSNLTGGTHKFTVIDNVGCEKYFKYVVNFPGYVNTTSPIMTQPDCAGQGANGTIAFTILSAGTFTVGYTTDPIAQPTTFVNYGTLNILLQGLSKGDYYVWIKPNTAACATKLAVQTITGSITQVSFDAPQLNCNAGLPEIRITNIKAAASAMTIQIIKKGFVTPDRSIILPTVPAGSLYVIKGSELPSVKGDYTINILQTQGTCTVASSSYDFAYNGVLAVSVQNIKSSYPDLPTGGFDLINFTGGQKPYFVTIRFDSASNPQINPLDFSPRTEEVTEFNNSLQFIKSYKALHAGRYHLTVNEDQGCSLEFDVRVPLDFAFDPNTIPNVFTPNGDGSNETFYIRNIPPDTQVNISNRWGAEVFSSKSYQNNWTGDNYPDGVYFYRISAGGNTFTGWVEIIRGR